MLDCNQPGSISHCPKVHEEGERLIMRSHGKKINCCGRESGNGENIFEKLLSIHGRQALPPGKNQNL